MSELSTSIAEPAYIARLALKSSPFNDISEVKQFFAGGQFEHRLNLLLHMVRSTDKVGLLIAEKGQGKSTLLTQLKFRAGDDLRLCFLDGKTLNATTAAAECLRSLGVADNEISTSSNQIETFKNRLQQLRKLNVKPLLLIDNAEYLSEDFIYTLSSWLSWQDDDQYLLQAIIASNKAITLEDEARIRAQEVDLPILAKHDIFSYVMHKLLSVGYQGDELFTEKELKDIYQKSAGNLALINQLVHQKLLGLTPTLKKSSLTFNLANLKWAGVAIIVIVLGVILSYQDQLNQMIVTADKSPDISTRTIIKIPEPELALVVADTPMTKFQEREELADLLAEIPATNKAVSKEPVVIDAPEVVIAEPAVIIKPEPDFYQQDWVLQQQTMHYTFQLMGSWDKQEVLEFIDKYVLTGDVAMFESLRSGRIWYALVYGIYTNKQEALAASSQWSAPLNTLPSWLRRFDSVQKQIKNRDSAQ